MSGSPKPVVTLNLSPQEMHVLQRLPAMVRKHLDSEDFKDKYVRRLFPKPSKDREEAKEFRSLLHDDIRARKLEHLATFEQCVAGAVGGQLPLTAAQADHMIAFLADLRTVLAVSLGIEDESWYRSHNPAHPASREEMIYHYAGYLQTHILHHGLGVAEDTGWGGGS